jgi:surfeit locus 1 family protein
VGDVSPESQYDARLDAGYVLNAVVPTDAQYAVIPTDGAQPPRSPGSPGLIGNVPRRHSVLFRVVAGTLAILFFLVFVGLGTWQLKRRVWKLDLIARVEQRVHAPPVAPPGPAQWPQVTAAEDEYLHVRLVGTFVDQSQTLVQAVTELGAGYWVVTPLRTADGSLVLINRGFVPLDARDRVQAGGAASITGLLRMTEPGGAFLRHNAPAEGRWYSRDVQAIARARGLTDVAPYFVDADAGSNGRSDTGARVAPVGGLTVIHFHNSHLVYAITWYTLALMVAGAVWVGVRSETRA